MTFIERDPLEPLQRAMYSVLSQDEFLSGLGVTVFDHVDRDIYPRVVIGEDRGNPEETACYSATDVISTVRVFTNTIGRTQVKQISGRIRYLLTRQGGFSVEGFGMSIGHCERVLIEDHQDEHIKQGIIELNYRLVPMVA